MDECKDLKPWICGGTLAVVYPDVCEEDEEEDEE